MPDLSQATQPEIRVTPPGPNAKEVLERDRAYFAQCNSRPYPLVVRRGYNIWIEDVDDNVYLDCSAGVAVTSTGHCHPDVVKRIADQAGNLIHMSGTDFYYEVEVGLAERLCKLMADHRDYRVFFCNSGTEANEAGMKLARFATKRPRLIAFSGSFHGRTLGSLSMTSSRTVQMEGYFPLLPGVSHFPYPDPYRHPFGGNPATVTDDVIRFIADALERYLPPDEVAVVYCEAIQGEGGYIVPPQDFFPKLRALCDKHGILIACDEVQSGVGRTGKMFAHEHVPGFHPDIITIGKGIASGLPLGAMIARAELMKNWGPGRHGSTFGGNPVACAAGLTTMDLIESKYMQNAAVTGAHLMAELKHAIGSHPKVGDIRGRGLMLAVDFVTDKTSKQPDATFANQLESACYRNGLLILRAGRSSIRFCPALTISKEQASLAVKIFAATLKQQG